MTVLTCVAVFLIFQYYIILRSSQMEESHENSNYVLVTAALPYVNNHPHLGNIIGSVLSSDVFTRYLRQRRRKVLHVCGTDEYGTATEMAAIEQGKSPREIVDEFSKIHKRVYDWFGIHFDYFGRTSCESHRETVEKIYHEIKKEGHFEVKKMELFYCPCCEIFLADRFVKGLCYKCRTDSKGDQCDECGTILKATDLIDPRCAVCNKNAVTKESEHIFFSLDYFKERLSLHFSRVSNSWSKNAISITRDWLAKELHGRCITRDLKWGIHVPDKEFSEKVFYVWFDAPIGYVTFSKCLCRDLGIHNVFLDPNTELFQFMGKDNVPFHSVIFPAVLMATGSSYKLVDTISSTEYLLFEGKKFSKSKNVGVFGVDLVEHDMGIPCYWRYYLLKIRPESKDTTFSIEDFKTVVVTDLINNLGNFVNRTLKYIDIKCQGTIEEIRCAHEAKDMFIENMGVFRSRYIEHMDAIRLKQGLMLILDTCNFCNEFIQSHLKDHVLRDSIFFMSFSAICLISEMIAPFLPNTSSKIRTMTKIDSNMLNDHFSFTIPGHKIGKVDILFNMLTDDQIQNLNKFKFI